MSNKFFKKQKGVSLLITFFIMVLVLAAVMAVAGLLYTEAKSMRDMGNSVAAFYAADSGVEKALYYSRQTGGVCAIEGAQKSGDDCTNCTDCTVTFSDSFDNASYSLEADVITPGGLGSNLDIKSTGFFGQSSRKMEVKVSPQQGNSGNITVSSACATQDNGNITVRATVSAQNPQVFAVIYLGTDASKTFYSADGQSSGIDPYMIDMTDNHDGTYALTWTGPQNTYFVDLYVIDDYVPPHVFAVEKLQACPQ